MSLLIYTQSKHTHIYTQVNRINLALVLCFFIMFNECIFLLMLFNYIILVCLKCKLIARTYSIVIAVADIKLVIRGISFRNIQLTGNFDEIFWIVQTTLFRMDRQNTAIKDYKHTTQTDINKGIVEQKKNPLCSLFQKQFLFWLGHNDTM